MNRKGVGIDLPMPRDPLYLRKSRSSSSGLDTSYSLTIYAHLVEVLGLGKALKNLLQLLESS